MNALVLTLQLVFLCISIVAAIYAAIGARRSAEYYAHTHRDAQSLKDQVSEQVRQRTEIDALTTSHARVQGKLYRHLQEHDAWDVQKQRAPEQSAAPTKDELRGQLLKPTLVKTSD